MSVVYDVYGLAEAILGDEPGRLADVLGITWEEHDSDYRGRYFHASGPPAVGGELILQSNDLRDETGDYFQLPGFPDYRHLLLVNESAHPDEVRERLSALPQWRFLRRRELD
ncbi:hypothetical protein KOI35_41230 [Actinoplanes bogorensis]|uniref:YCII-related domain-containing protein n=1 Tax=Paractinoplanes bogorensis TaxID=1610840 RepID=A0ABS5Z3L5_9ACTN|nr:hypothetical protein [Actinoplanes bogorensis]MBU2669951.1 hypothetical protein [Actinoplanes bogorensis]